MVQAMINISKEANRVLNIIKAEHDLKDKSAAIEKITEIYEKLADNSKVRPEYLRKLSEISKGKHISREEFLKRM